MISEAVGIAFMVTTYSKKSMDQPSGQLNREINIALSAFAPENLVSRDEFGSPVPCQAAHLHTQAESSAYSRDSSHFPRRRCPRKICTLNRHYVVGSVPSLSGHKSAHRWRSLPRVRRHRARRPKGTIVPVTGAAFFAGFTVWTNSFLCTVLHCTVLYLSFPPPTI